MGAIFTTPGPKYCLRHFFIRCTALLLNIDILYVSDTSTKETPFSLISCTSNDSNQLLEGRQLAHMLIVREPKAEKIDFVAPKW